MKTRYVISFGFLGLLIIVAPAMADPVVYETFSDYPDNALISKGPAGPAIGLTGDWSLDAENFFYVNMTEADPEAGTGKAVYDMPWDDNGQRTAQRAASPLQVLLQDDGDVLYASFRIHPARSQGTMLFRLDLVQITGGGQPDLSFGMNGGDFVVGNGGVNLDVTAGEPAEEEMQVVLRVEYGEGSGGTDDFEVVTLWVDPVDENSVPVIDAAQVDFLNPGGARLTGIAIRGDQMGGQPAFFDDLAIGHAFLDVVEAAPSDALTNHAGINGLFYDSENPGHGFNFAAHLMGFTAYYYGHTDSGERLWLVSDNYLGDLGFGEPFELQMYEVVSGMFGHPELPAVYWGDLTLELDDCDSGHALLDGEDGVLEMEFVRLSAIPGIGCR